MKIRLTFLISLFLVAFNSFGQIGFQKVISAGIACTIYAVHQTNDEGYIMCGYTLDSLSDNEYVYLIKTDLGGDILWSKTYGRINSNEGYSVRQTMDGGYIATGLMTDSGNNQYIYIIKTNANGDTLWTNAYSGSYGSIGNSITQTGDSGYVIAGSAYGSGGNNIYVCLLKINAAGVVIWNKTYGNGGYEFGNCVKQTADSGYIVCGYTNSFGAGNNDVYLIKTDANGDTLWTKTYGGNLDDYGNSVLQTTDGGYIIAGYTASFGAGDADVYLIKTNADGDTLWTKTYGGNGFDAANDVYQTTDSGYIIVGDTWSFGNGNDDIYLIKTNAEGDILWTETYGGPSNDYGTAVMQTNDGGYIIAGNTLNFLPTQVQNGIYLIKTDADGTSGCFQNTTNTIYGPTATMVGSTNSIIDSGITASATNTIVGSVGNDSIICWIEGIRELNNDNSIFLYPNPVKEKITIYDLRITIARIEIYNVLRKVCQQSEIVNRKSEIDFDVSSLACGLYFVRITDEKESWSGKFVKE